MLTLPVATADCQTQHTLHHSSTHTLRAHEALHYRPDAQRLTLNFNAGHDKRVVDAKSGSYETECCLNVTVSSKQLAIYIFSWLIKKKL
jgi:hypothetical protein